MKGSKRRATRPNGLEAQKAEAGFNMHTGFLVSGEREERR